MADRDHRQWLEDEEERKKIHGTKRAHQPQHREEPPPTPDSPASKQSLLENERRQLEDWQQDPIA